MPIEVELPDGTIAEFPDGTDHETMAGALDQHYSQQFNSDFRGPEAGQIPDMQATTRGGPKAYIPDGGEGIFDEFTSDLGDAFHLAGKTSKAALGDVGSFASRFQRPEGQKVGLLPSLGAIKTAYEKNTPYADEAGGNLYSTFTEPLENQLPIENAMNQAATEGSEGAVGAATLGHFALSAAETAPLLAVGALPGWAAKLVSLGFTADMIYHAPQLFQEYADEINKPEEEQDKAKIAKLRSGIAATFTFAPMAGKHGMEGVTDKLSTAFDNANRFAPGPKTGGPRASDRGPLPTLQMPMQIAPQPDKYQIRRDPETQMWQVIDENGNPVHEAHDRSVIEKARDQYNAADKGGEENASEVPEAAEVHGDVRPSEQQGQHEGVPVEEGGEGIQQEAERRVLSPDEHQQLRELKEKWHKGDEFTAEELDTLESLDARNSAVMEAPADATGEDRGRIATADFAPGETGKILRDVIKREGLEGKVDVVLGDTNQPGDPFYGRVAQFNTDTGRIEIGERALQRELESAPPELRTELAHRILNEEHIHSHTTPEEAEAFGANLSPAERQIAHRIYLGKKGSGIRQVLGDQLSNRQLGWEVIRRRVQRLNRLTPTEMLNVALRERWTLESLDMLDRIVVKSRKFLDKDVSKEQERIFNKVTQRLDMVREAIKTSGAGGPAVMSKATEKRIEKLRKERLAQIRDSERHDLPDEKIDARIAQLNRKTELLTDAELYELRDLRLERDRRYREFPGAMSRKDSRGIKNWIKESESEDYSLGKWSGLGQFKSEMDAHNALSKITRGGSGDFESAVFFNESKDRFEPFYRVLRPDEQSFPAAMSKVESVDDFVDKLPKEKLSTYDAVEAGFKAKTVDDLEALRKAKADIKVKMTEARKSGNMDAAFKLGSDNQMIREAIETATDTGSNSVQKRRPNEPHYGEQPSLGWSRNPEVADWLRKNGDEVGVKLPDESPAAMSKAYVLTPEGKLDKAEEGHAEYAERLLDKLNNGRPTAQSHYNFMADKGYHRVVVDDNSITVTELAGKRVGASQLKNLKDTAIEKGKELWVEDYSTGKSRLIYRPEGESPAAMSKKKAKELEDLRKYQEAMLQRPVTRRTTGLGEAVAPEERVSAEQSGALPRISAADIDTKADQMMAGEITPRKQTTQKMDEKVYQRWKNRAVKLMGDRDFEFYSKLSEANKDRQMRAQFSEAKNIRGSYDRPQFQEFEKWVNRNVGHVEPHQLRNMWEDSVWSHLLKATPERLQEWRKALGLEIKYGKGFVAPERGPEQFQLEPEGNKIVAKQNRAQLEAGERYRNKLITAIAEKLIGESVKERADLNRTEVSNDDIDFTATKSKHGPYVELSLDDISNEHVLNGILRDQARASSKDPKSHSRRLVAVVDRKTGEVELLSTYNDFGTQRVTDPAGARLPGKPSRTLDKAFLKQYRPISSLLLKDPVKGFRQNFESVADFNDKIGKEAHERAAVGEFHGEGPADFTAEGTPGLQGEGGMFQGPHRTTMRRGSMESAGRLTRPEAEGVISHVLSEVGELDSPNDVKVALLGLLDKSARGRMRATDYIAQSGYRKMINALQREFPDLTREEVLDKMADRIYENNRSSETLDEYARKTVAQFKGSDLGNAVQQANAPQAGQELTMPINRVPPTMVRPEQLPPGTPPVERQPSPSGQLGSETPVREQLPTEVTTAQREAQTVEHQARVDVEQIRARTLRKYGVEMTPGQAGSVFEGRTGRKVPADQPRVSEVQDNLQEEAAHRAGKEYQVGQDWAAALGEREIIGRINKRDVRVIRDRVLREQGILLSPKEARGILEAKKGFRQPMEMTNRAIFKRAERDINAPLKTESPAAMSRAREGVDPDTKNPIPRFVPNINTALTRKVGIERIPGLRLLWGDRAKVKDSADLAMVAHGIKRAIGNSQAAITGSRLAALTKLAGNPFEQDATGKITNVNKLEGQSAYPSDLFEDWQKQVVIPEKMEASGKFNDTEIAEYTERNPQKIKLNDAQDALFREYLSYIEDGNKYLQEKNAKLEDYGGESKETRRDQGSLYGIGHGLEVYTMPRLALHKRGLGPIEAEYQKRIGGSYQIEKDRLYSSEEIGAGEVVYEPDMNKRLTTFVQRVYKAVADSDLASDPALRGETAEQRIPKLSKEYEREMRLPASSGRHMSQQDIIDMGYRPRLGREGQVGGHPAFQDKIYPIDVANRLNKRFGNEAHPYITRAIEANIAMKGLMLTGDLAQYFQQGSLLAARHPKIFADATWKSLQSLKDPNVTGNYLNNPENFKAATEFVQAGGSLGHLQDFMSGAKPGEALTKIPVMSEVITRSGRAFGTFQDIAKIEVWKALKDSTPKEQWPDMIEAIEDLGLSGKMEASGMSHKRAIAERLLFLASSYYRGAFNVVARAAMEGGKAGTKSRRDLFQYMAAMTAMMTTAYIASGMSKNEIKKRLTPGQKNQKFLKYPVNIGGETLEIGPGGIVLSLLNLTADMGKTAVTDPKNLLSPPWMWLKQRLGPIPSLGEKLYTGKDVFDRSINPFQAAAQSVTPIPIQKGISAAQSSKKGAAIVSAGASFIGLDSNKYKATSEIHDLAQDFARSSGMKKESGFDEVANEHPSYSKLRGAVGAERQGAFNDILKEMEKTRTRPDIRKAMKHWSQSPFTGNKRLESAFRGSLNDYEEKVYLEAQDERDKVYGSFLDMLSKAP